MLQSAWFKTIALPASVVIIIAVAMQLTHKNRKITYPDQCVSCHTKIKNVGKSHPISVFGCASCHGGNKYATNKEIAHKGMLLNPSNLNNAEKSCGKCHPDILKRVKNSVMTTNEGIINDTNFQLGFTKNPHGSLSVNNLKQVGAKNNFAIKYYRKMCAACHVNQNRKIFKQYGFVERGGGCADCHVAKDKEKQCNALTTHIPDKNCLKCHNRSGRIGLAYFGHFESTGYGTPYKNGLLSRKIAKENRYWYKLSPDIHQKDGLSCIDCHTSIGVMGTNHRHKRMWGQVDIECNDCHEPKLGPPDALAKKLLFLNGKIPKSGLMAYTNKFHTYLYNVQKINGKVYFYFKKTGKRVAMPIFKKKAYHTLSFHKRLSCQACHSSWAQSCYGCHVAYFKNGKQYDWIAHKITSGSFSEFNSFYRHSISLGISYNKKIMPFVPGCQTFVTKYLSSGTIKQFHKITFAPIAPHTTLLKSRSCATCHINPVTLGLGQGTLYIKNGKIDFTPIYQSKASGLPIDYPLDSFASLSEKFQVLYSMLKERSFNKTELHHIIFAWRCIICHDKYSDKIYINYKKSVKLFDEGLTKCSK